MHALPICIFEIHFSILPYLHVSPHTIQEMKWHFMEVPEFESNSNIGALETIEADLAKLSASVMSAIDEAGISHWHSCMHRWERIPA